MPHRAAQKPLCEVTKVQQNGFPKQNFSAYHGELGNQIISKIIHRDLKWLYRRIHQELDYGIDGYIDIVMDDGTVTGKSIAIQIKCGTSYFSKKSHNGYWYYGETKHINFYMNHPVPIILIIVNPETEIALWTEFSIEQTESTGNAWRISIPENKEFSFDSKDQLLSLTDVVEDYSESIESYWAMNSFITDNNFKIIHFVIDRNDIEQGIPDYVCDFFERLNSNDSLSLYCQGKVDISVFGYEDDDRDLFMIQEVRNYFKIIEPIVKYWFYYLCTNPKSHSLKLLVSCLCEIESFENRLAIFNEKDIERFFTQNFCWLNEFTEQKAISLDQNKEISQSIFEYFQLNSVSLSG